MASSVVPNIGSGWEKGGGSGGTIRESGGAFGEREFVLEEMYFRDLTDQQLRHLKEHHMDEIRNLEASAKQAEESFNRYKAKLENLKNLAKHLHK
jgi:hypothetical protein